MHFTVFVTVVIADAIMDMIPFPHREKILKEYMHKYEFIQIKTLMQKYVKNQLIINQQSGLKN